MSTLGHFIMTFFIAMLPVLELRGAIPIGTAAGLDPRLALAAAFLGNLVPVPFIVIFIRKIFVWLRTKSEFLDRIVAKMEAKAEKNADKVLPCNSAGRACSGNYSLLPDLRRKRTAIILRFKNCRRQFF